MNARASFTSAAADRLLSMASVVLCRRVALEDRDVFRKVRADLNKVLAAVGFAEAHNLARVDDRVNIGVNDMTGSIYQGQRRPSPYQRTTFSLQAFTRLSA